MIQKRPSNERGHFDHGWLDTFHTFSFADYHDPRFMGFRSLRVINEDRVAPSQGFGRHPHRDMEIITYVISGALQHRDSLGNGSIIKPGTVQYMAAGKGIFHEEFNPSRDEAVHLIQIWIMPNRKGVAPAYEQRDFPALHATGELTLLASGDGRAGSIRINQDAQLYAAALRPGQTVQHALAANRGLWVQVLEGDLRVGDQRLNAGDGAAVEGQEQVVLATDSGAKALVFDLQ